jgi:hypothetical protein
MHEVWPGSLVERGPLEAAVSYTVNLPATQRDCDVEGAPDLSVTTFGDGEHGHMVQITVGGQFVQLTPWQVKDLRRLLKEARKRSLVDWPGAI